MHYTIRWFKCELKPPKNRNFIQKIGNILEPFQIIRKKRGLTACFALQLIKANISITVEVRSGFGKL